MLSQRKTGVTMQHLRKTIPIRMTFFIYLDACKICYVNGGNTKFTVNNLQGISVFQNIVK